MPPPDGPHPAARAAGPQPAAEQPAHGNDTGSEGMPAGHRTFTIHADGSSHGGRHFFDSSRENAWEEAAAEEYALEDHSLRDAPHPALQMVRQPRSRGGSTRGGPAGLAALQAAEEGHRRLRATWVAEDGRAKGGSFGNAVVQIEEPSEKELFNWGAYLGSLPKKLKGGLDTRLPVPPLRDVFWSWLGAFLGILAVCAMNQWVTPEIDIAFVVGSFGASAVLVFALLESKMSQPRNFLGGQMLSALVGITVRVIIPKVWIAGPVGMSLALVAMQLTATTHPPGGATALIACTLPTLPKWHGYSYLVTIGVGSVVMQLIALVVNNIDPRRRYPTFWW